MAIKLGSNISSLSAQRHLGEAASKLGGHLERLSSGLRINHASDDAAGLAIASSLDVRQRVYTQGSRNLNDGISFLNIADSALDQLSQITTRITELAEQSANGTYSSKQRAALDHEAQQLSEEYFRIARSTTFNGINLFDGSVAQGARFQSGFGTSGSILASLGGAVGTGVFGSQSSGFVGCLASGDFNGDGVLDVLQADSSYMTVRLGNGDGTFSVGQTTPLLLPVDPVGGRSPYYNYTALAVGDINGDDILDFAYREDWSTDVQVMYGNGNGSFRMGASYYMGYQGYAGSGTIALADLNGDGKADLVVGSGELGQQNFTAVRLSSGSGTLGSIRTFDSDSSSSFSFSHLRNIALADLDSDGLLDLVSMDFDGFNQHIRFQKGRSDGTFGSSTDVFVGFITQQDYSNTALEFGDLNGDGRTDLVATSSFATQVLLGNGNGTFRAGLSWSGIQGQTVSNEGSALALLELADLDGDGVLDIIEGVTDDAAPSTFVVRLGNGDGSFRPATSYTQVTDRTGFLVADFNNDGVMDFGGDSIRFGLTREGISALPTVSLKTTLEAKQALTAMQQVATRLSPQRGIIGASQSRLATALRTTEATTENYAAASSRIKDADIAVEAAGAQRTEILKQAATSVLAQANQQPLIVLNLLRT